MGSESLRARARAPPYAPRRFFLPLGMAMLNQKALLFFHYPPIRLLDTNQDYLNDPVPVRCEELLTANGVAAADLPLFNTVMDATPIGAEDDQGSKTMADRTTPVVDAIWGAIRSSTSTTISVRRSRSSSTRRP